MGYDTFIAGLTAFIRESNLIEGIDRDPTAAEIDATRFFLAYDVVSLGTVCELQQVCAPGKPLRDRAGMDVRVGHYIAPRGGPEIRAELVKLCARVSGAVQNRNNNPWLEHCRLETLHPWLDGNGRTGRAIWAWHMIRIGQDPFAMPFLRRFYYQTLEHSR